MPLFAAHVTCTCLFSILACRPKYSVALSMFNYVCTKYSRCQSPSTDFTDLFCFVVCLLKKISAFECAMAGLDGHEIRELINPLISASQPAGAFQQILYNNPKR